MIPKYYEFQNSTKILSGEFALENIPTELKMLNAKRPLFLSDETLKQIGTLQIVLDAIEKQDFKVGKIYTEIPPDSDLELIKKIAKIYKEENCDSIIALGGGSVIDTAKGVRMVLSQEIEDIRNLMGAEILTYGKHIPFVSIPTTAGTGSEVTAVAVILEKLKQIKMEFISYNLLPDLAVIDFRMTKTLPKKIAASTGMDALCHAIEAYTCLQKNPMSDAYAISAIKLIGENLIESVEKGSKIARIAMANASMMAGVSFSNSMVGLVHAIGHALGGVCKVPHGNAMNILLPFCMKYNMDKIREQYGEILLYLAGEEVYLNTPKDKRGEKTVQIIEEMKEKLNKLTGLPITLKEAGVKEEDLPEVAKKAINDGAIIVNPKEAGYEDVLEILQEAY